MNTKTPGEVAFLAYGYTDWDECSIQDKWHEVAAAVIAHHDASQKPQPWQLPSPPADRKWHRTDWTEEMLPDGWRPLLLGENEQPQDEYLCCTIQEWCPHPMTGGATRTDYHRRTRRPLPPVQQITITLPPLKLTTGNHSIASH